jgi:geranylgeranyl diphosphate synthase type II
MNLSVYLRQRQTLVNRALDRTLPSPNSAPGRIHEAMRYSVLGEGKRIRPVLALAACEAAGGKTSDALHAACALELIHAYSLVHDDLPAMDDDDFRRGKPSCHKKFGEALGILTGDALLTYAFDLLTRANHDRGGQELAAGNGAASSSRSHGASVHLRVIREVAEAVGTKGMVGGQVADVASTQRGQTPRGLTPQAVEFINAKKTGALISVSVRAGALLGRAKPAAYRALSRYGDRVGLVFQLVDDLLDKDGAVRLQGKEQVWRRAQRLTQEAVATVRPLGVRAEPLRELARFILKRKS